mgnify:CR=1 FL=1
MSDAPLSRWDHEIQKRLESVGSSMENVLKVNVYLADRRRRQAIVSCSTAPLERQSRALAGSGFGR